MANDLKLDVTAWPVMSILYDKMQSTFSDHGIPLNRIMMLWSENPILDPTRNCNGSEAWIRPVMQVPSLTFPTVQETPIYGARQNPAKPWRLATTIEVGMMHCNNFPKPPSLPSTDSMIANAELAAAEAAAMRVAICNAMVAAKREYQLIAYAPLDDGLASGGYWQVSFDWIRGEK